ncbi:DUF2846 domain-containing protein [Rheinheimera sp. YQF-2]|uniref:DUF2846 domain-containing protein n=1 Tax=Rheinheimera lutimaris TaxID=2740584 RepID=A0A7Y5AU36_9GAMM|nr:DUF2846 domain-containing protein [Rheinheimera lutimaris]NRQ44463.1 DUF2846 domain-containing protein [Rheinheimera lutimaris]
MKFVICLLAVLLSSCASAPKDAATFDMVDIPESGAGESVFVFYRTYTPPAAYDMRISINDKQITALPNNTFSYARLTPGKFKLKISWHPLSGMFSNEQELEIKAGETFFLQLSSSVWMPIGIQLGSDEHAAQNQKSAIEMLRKCCKYVASIEL